MFFDISAYSLSLKPATTTLHPSGQLLLFTPKISTDRFKVRPVCVYATSDVVMSPSSQAAKSIDIKAIKSDIFFIIDID